MRRPPAQTLLPLLFLLAFAGPSLAQNLNCAAPTPVSCPLPTTEFNNQAGANNVTAYSCAAGPFSGNELVLQVTVPRLSHMGIDVQPRTGGRTYEAFLLSACDEGTCINHGTTFQASYLERGTYFLVIDGLTSSDNGRFNVTLTCTDVATQLPCNGGFSMEATSGANVIANWSCLNGQTGPERHYEVTVPPGSTFKGLIGNKSNPNLNVLVSGPGGIKPTAPACIAGGPTQASIYNASGTYYITVDGAAGASGTYDVVAACGRFLNCTASQFLDIMSGQTVSGDTTGANNNNDSYLCASSAYGPPGERSAFTGPENVWDFTVPTAATVAFLFDSPNPDLRLMILSECYEGACLAEGGCAENLPAGNYRLVVDGLNGAAGPYQITPIVIPTQSYNHWTACPECNAGCTNQAGDISKKEWHFDSGNFCGTGCDFSLFAVVECGSEFHIPFWDVETGHMQIVDTFTGQPVTITATNDLPANPGIPNNCKLTQTSTLVQWEDSGCSAIPCPPANCGGGRDCVTNNRVMDVSFQGTPTVCGVYRMDFLNWGGYEWSVYANCTQDRTPQFNIYHNLCSAIANYRPRPEVGLSNLVVDSNQCAQSRLAGTIDVQNVGCQGVANLQLVITEDPPAPPNPVVIPITLGVGQAATIPWVYNLAMVPSGLSFTVDPLNQIQECSEGLGQTVSCGFGTTLQRVIDEPVCLPCRTTASAGADDTICEGPYTLDGSGSVMDCGAYQAQYRWEDSSGIPLPGCDWSSSPTCNVVLVPGLRSFTLRTRCLGSPVSCETTDVTTIDVTSATPPPALGNTLSAVRRTPDAVFTWSANPDPSITGYRVFRDGLEAVPAATRATVCDTALAVLTCTDPSAVTQPPNPAYYQLVAVGCNPGVVGPY